MTPQKPSSAGRPKIGSGGELAAWAKILDSGAADIKANVAPTLQHWKEDTDLAGIRDEKELAKLPEDEAACIQTALERRRSAPLQGE